MAILSMPISKTVVLGLVAAATVYANADSADACVYCTTQQGRWVCPNSPAGQQGWTYCIPNYDENGHPTFCQYGPVCL